MDGLISNLVRPFRFTYSLLDLGAKKTESYERIDGTILNERGYRIHYSFYRNLKSETDTCFIYSHCNSGCRVEGNSSLSEGLAFIELIM